MSLLFGFSLSSEICPLSNPKTLFPIPANPTPLPIRPFLLPLLFLVDKIKKLDYGFIPFNDKINGTVKMREPVFIHYRLKTYKRPEAINNAE